MAETTEHQSSLAALLPDFERHLKQHSAKTTVDNYMRIARRFVAFIGNEPVQGLTEDVVAEFFKDVGATSHYKKNAGMVIGHLLRFALLRLLVPAGKRGPTVPAPDDPVQDAREIALRERWNFDRLLQEKERGDDVIAMLGLGILCSIHLSYGGTSNTARYSYYFLPPCQTGAQSVPGIQSSQLDCRRQTIAPYPGWLTRPSANDATLPA
jgi:hypothetical protein